MADVRVRVGLNASSNSHIDIDKTNGLKYVEALSQSTGQPKDIFYGCIANSGSAEIIDINGEILNMLQDGTIENSNMPVELFVNGNLIETHITTDSEYNSNTKNFTVSMTNDISKWDDIMFRGKPLVETPQSAYEIVLEIMLSLGYAEEDINNKMLSNTLVYGNTNMIGTIKEYLETIIIPYPYLSSATYRQTLDKICQMAQLQIYAGNDGIPVFVSARPVISEDMLNNSIHVPKSYMETNLEKTVILKNKYDAIEMDETLVSRAIAQNAYCGDAASNDVTYETESAVVAGTRAKDNGTYEMRLKLYFKPFTVTIPAKTNFNLNKTNSVQSFTSVVTLSDNIIIDDIKTYTYYIDTLNETISISPSIIETEFGGSSIDQERITAQTYNPQDDTFTISFIGCVGRDCSTYFSQYGVAGSTVLLDEQSYRAKSINFSFFGEQAQVRFEEQDVSSGNVSQSKTIAKLKSNEILQSKTQIGSIKISTLIKNNIFSDYKSGVSNASVKLFCGNMFSSSGNLLKDWSKGEIINVNDILHFDNDTYIDKSQRYWRVVGRRVSKSGVPKLQLDLQEVRVPEQLYVFSFKITNMFELLGDKNLYADVYINGEKKLIQDITAVKKGDILRIVRKKAYSPTKPDRYYLLLNIRIGGIQGYVYTDGEDYEITGDTEITAQAHQYSD